jgi:fructokinase
MSSAMLYGGLELGGTTIKCGIAANTPTNVIQQQSFPTTDPQTTLDHAVKYFQQYPDIVSLGIGSFGPVDLNPQSGTYGYITTTPKPRWQNAPVVQRFIDSVRPGLKIAFNTDVNAAAAGELKWGEHNPAGSQSNIAYITVGTGIGAGIVVADNMVTGCLHPESGHIPVKRHAKDEYKGSCPYHKDCCEGLASAAAIAERAGISSDTLASLPDDHITFEIAAYYLAQLAVNLALIVSPEVIIFGGGVLKRKILFSLIRKHFLELLNGYIRSDKMLDVDHYIVPSRFDAENSITSAGMVGCLELARKVNEDSELDAALVVKKHNGSKL